MPRARAGNHRPATRPGPARPRTPGSRRRSWKPPSARDGDGDGDEEDRTEEEGRGGGLWRR